MASCYRNSLALAVKHDMRSIAFPAISTGVYSFPLERATEIAVAEVARFLVSDATIEQVVFVCFDRRTFEVYQTTLKERGA